MRRHLPPRRARVAVAGARARTSTRSTSAASRRCCPSHSARHAACCYTSSFLALPPRGRTRRSPRTTISGQKCSRRTRRGGGARHGPIVRLYPGVIYGPGVYSEGNLIGRMVRDHLQGRLPGVVGADRPWSYSWIDDVAEAHVPRAEAGRRRKRTFWAARSARRCVSSRSSAIGRADAAPPHPATRSLRSIGVRRGRTRSRQPHRRSSPVAR